MTDTSVLTFDCYQFKHEGTGVLTLPRISIGEAFLQRVTKRPSSQYAIRLANLDKRPLRFEKLKSLPSKKLALSLDRTAYQNPDSEQVIGV